MDDVWSGEWDQFQTAVADMICRFIRMFNERDEAFYWERVVEQVRVNAQKTPAEPWSDKNKYFGEKWNYDYKYFGRKTVWPFIRPLRFWKTSSETEKQRADKKTTAAAVGNDAVIKDPNLKCVYFLVHPCEALISMQHICIKYRQTVNGRSLAAVNIINKELYDLMLEYRSHINESYRTMNIIHDKKVSLITVNTDLRKKFLNSHWNKVHRETNKQLGDIRKKIALLQQSLNLIDNAGETKSNGAAPLGETKSNGDTDIGETESNGGIEDTEMGEIQRVQSPTSAGENQYAYYTSLTMTREVMKGVIADYKFNKSIRELMSGATKK